MNLQHALGTRIPNGILNFFFKLTFARKVRGGAFTAKTQNRSVSDFISGTSACFHFLIYIKCAFLVCPRSDLFDAQCHNRLTIVHPFFLEICVAKMFLMPLGILCGDLSWSHASLESISEVGAHSTGSVTLVMGWLQRWSSEETYSFNVGSEPSWGVPNFYLSQRCGNQTQHPLDEKIWVSQPQDHTVPTWWLYSCYGSQRKYVSLASDKWF